MGLVASGPMRAGLRRLGYTIAIIIAVVFLLGFYLSTRRI